MKKLSCLVSLLFFSTVSAVNISSFLNYKFNENHAIFDTLDEESQNVSVIFWNIENLYDPYNDSTKLDDEFTSTGAKHWNWNKFSKKLNHIAKTLIAAGRWHPPAIIGLCEVENRYVLNKLIYETPLKAFNYRIVHHESPDLRGVDVALLYRKEIFRVIEERPVTIHFPFDANVQTRELLLVKGIFLPEDTVYLIVNHWPSRRGGYLQSQPRRKFVATVVKNMIDSIQKYDPMANIIAMGDFNDEPEDESLLNALGAKTCLDTIYTKGLYNLMGIRNRDRREGTLKFRDQWSTFDQFVISGTLIQGLSGLTCGTANVEIIKVSFLFEEDKTYFGEKLRRTYNGPAYVGGFSDHLPIRLIIHKVRKN